LTQHVYQLNSVHHRESYVTKVDPKGSPNHSATSQTALSFLCLVQSVLMINSWDWYEWCRPPQTLSPLE